MKRLFRLLFRIVVLLSVLLLVAFVIIWIREWRPEPVENILETESKAVLRQGDTLRIVSWNIGYAGLGDDMDFFYDGGTRMRTSCERTLQNLHGIIRYLQEQADALRSAVQADRMGINVYQDSLAALLKAYKDDVKMHYIFAAPNMASSYFALFQKLDNYMIFDPLNNKDDVKCFAAVATSLNNLYPHADRSRNLYNIVIKGMKNTRPPRQEVIELPEDKVRETGVIDINLRDMQGNMHRLSELQGKVVILDFTVYQSAVSASHNYMLRDLYDKYAARGLEIYQVSLDADEHYWKTTADNLPWICVRDGNGVYSGFVSAYNVQSLPQLFLINRNNELSARGETIKDLEAAVKALL